MSQPATYNRQYNFTEYQALNPTLPLPGVQVDLELNSVKTTLDQTLSNLKLIQRDDGRLANASVGYDQLSSEVVLGITPSTAWTTGVSYVVGNTVFFGLQLFRCLIAHTAGTFATDLAAGRWLLIADFSALVTAGVASVGGATGVITVPGGNISGNALTVVRYDVGQSLTTPQKTQALTNMGAQATISAGTGISITGVSVANDGVLTIAGNKGAFTVGTGLKNVVNDLQNDGVLSISGIKGAVIAGTGLAVAGQNLNNDGVTTIAGNKGDFTLTEGITNAGNALRLDPQYQWQYLAGFTLVTTAASATITASAGACVDSTNTQEMLLASAMAKTTASWVQGTGNGGLDTGSIAPNTWYHVHAIKKSGQPIDVLLSLSATAPTLPGTWGAFRRIGSAKTNGSSQWIQFVQVGDDFLWLVPPGDIAVATLGASPTSFVLGGVPTGVKVLAHITGFLSNAAGGTSLLVQSPDATGAGPSGSTGLITARVTTGGIGVAFVTDIRTNTSAQIVAYADSASSTLNVSTKGWIDFRGKV